MGRPRTKDFDLPIGCRVLPTGKINFQATTDEQRAKLIEQTGKASATFKSKEEARKWWAKFMGFEPGLAPEIAKLQPAPWKPRCGIYVLYCRDVVVYVGQSLNIDKRIDHHRLQAPFRWDRVAIIECPRGKLNAMESRYIKLFSPKNNITYNPTAMLRRGQKSKGISEQTSEPPEF